jgi:hypothetical protein
MSASFSYKIFKNICREITSRRMHRTGGLLKCLYFLLVSWLGRFVTNYAAYRRAAQSPERTAACQNGTAYSADTCPYRCVPALPGHAAARTQA